MLKKLIFVAACMLSTTSCFGGLIFSDKPPVIEPKEVGRYQMVAHPHGYLFLLDTATGQVWRSKLNKNWVYHDQWTLQIPDSPPQQ